MYCSLSKQILEEWSVSSSLIQSKIPWFSLKFTDSVQNSLIQSKIETLQQEFVVEGAKHFSVNFFLCWGEGEGGGGGGDGQEKMGMKTRYSPKTPFGGG